MSLFPIMVEFTSTKTFCEMQIGEVLNLETREPILFASSTMLAVESYSIV
ncbi:putative coatomer delta subunit [Pavlovales sp. CCMP2436]|nr:putative coatomer delta subunit [Pavlovales sp. CCMP2436]